MPATAKKNTNSKDKRERLNTTINSSTLYRAQALRFLLKARGIKMNGVNDLIEEGLEMVIDKYSDEMGVEVNIK